MPPHVVTVKLEVMGRRGWSSERRRGREKKKKKRKEELGVSTLGETVCDLDFATCLPRCFIAHSCQGLFVPGRTDAVILEVVMKLYSSTHHGEVNGAL